MSRISVWEALGAFLVSAAIVFILSGGIGVARQWSASNDADAARTERHLLRIIEGSEAPAGNEQGFGRAAASLRTILNEQQDATVDSAIQAVQGLGNASPDALNAVVPSDRWALYAPLADQSARERITALDGKYRLTEVIRTHATPSSGIAIPDLPPVWTRAEAIVWYLIGCALFVAIFCYRAYMDRKHPVLDAPWGRIPALIAFAAAAPATVPSVAGYGIRRLFAAEIPWGDRWDAFIRAAHRFGYRIRLLRRLPAPVLSPAMQAAEPARQDTAEPEHRATPENEASGDAPGEESEEAGGNEWYVVDPDEILGREHLLAAAGVPYYPIAIGFPDAMKAFSVESARIADFERALDLDDADKSDEETDIERTVLRTYDGEIGETPHSRVPSERVAFVERVLEAVSMNNAGLDISFTHAGGGYVCPSVVDDDWIEVLHHASPAPPCDRVLLDSVYGHSRGDRCVIALSPAPGRGHVVKDSDGNAVVQVVGRKIYVLCDFLSIDEPWAASALARAIYDGIRVSEESPLDDDGDSAAWRETLDGEREKYVDLCIKRIEARGRSIEKEIEECDTEVREAGQRIAQAVRKRHGAVKALETLMNDERTAEAGRLRKEFDQLAAARPVLAVRAYPDRVEVDTRTVIIAHMGRRYEIGRFRIAISDRGTLSISNLSNTSSSTPCQHP
ncbi:MAG: hypothetical protein RL272_634, partial [Candidatus Parcubacteria bacterium]